MGGIIILLSVGGATLLWGGLANTYVWVSLVAMGGLGVVGFADDYVKTVRKQKDGLNAWYKVAGQVAVGFSWGACCTSIPTLRPTIRSRSFPF
jgi:UDP-N-acetylmuramyl pentapeptide phosphotransferase/UDP-N-acetylglucosamine-1-phosphate transferase